MKTNFFSVHQTRFSFLVLLLTLGLALAAQPSLGQNAAELLEKGIYNEETRGDLDAAIKLYQQALDEAQSNEAFAAQALLRLALCHQKLNRTSEATALLEKLIKEYPNQTGLVARAREFLPGELVLAPIPWSDREAMILHFRFPAGTELGMTAYYAYQDQEENRPVWVVGQRTFVAGAHSASAVVVEPDSFAPIRSWWKHALIGNSSAEFSQGAAAVAMADGTTRKVELETTTFDNEQAIHLIRRLPLRVGSEETITIISTLGGGTLIPLSVKVTKAEEIKVPAGTFNALKVELHPVNQFFWFSDDANRYLLRMEAGGVIGDLVQVRHLQPGQPNPYRDEELSFSFNVPADWFTYKGVPNEKTDRVRVAILDAHGDAHCGLLASPRSSLKQEVRSLKAWAEERAANGEKEALEFNVRPDSWTDTTVSGYPAISFIADYKEGQDKPSKVHYSLVVMCQEVAANFMMMVDADKFEAMKPQFDQVITSFIAK